MDNCIQESIRVAAVDVEIKVYGIYCSPCCNYFEGERCLLFRVPLKKDDWNIVRARSCKKSEIDVGTDFKQTVRIKANDKKEK